MKHYIVHQKVSKLVFKFYCRIKIKLMISKQFQKIKKVKEEFQIIINNLKI